MVIEGQDKDSRGKSGKRSLAQKSAAVSQAVYMKPAFTISIKKSERVGFFIKNLNSSFGFSFN
jgi:hypothetical protein